MTDILNLTKLLFFASVLLKVPRYFLMRTSIETFVMILIALKSENRHPDCILYETKCTVRIYLCINVHL